MVVLEMDQVQLTQIQMIQVQGMKDQEPELGLIN
jgi:hypothetical protein